VRFDPPFGGFHKQRWIVILFGKKTRRKKDLRSLLLAICHIQTAEHALFLRLLSYCLPGLLRDNVSIGTLRRTDEGAKTWGYLRSVCLRSCHSLRHVSHQEIGVTTTGSVLRLSFPAATCRFWKMAPVGWGDWFKQPASAWSHRNIPPAEAEQRKITFRKCGFFLRYLQFSIAASKSVSAKGLSKTVAFSGVRSRGYLGPPPVPRRTHRQIIIQFPGVLAVFPDRSLVTDIRLISNIYIFRFQKIERLAAFSASRTQCPASRKHVRNIHCINAHSSQIRRRDCRVQLILSGCLL